MSGEIHTPTTGHSESMTIVDILQKGKLLPEEELENLQKRSGSPEELERLLLREGHLTTEQLGQIRAKLFGVKFVDLHQEPLVPDVLKVLPRLVAEAQKAIVFRTEGTVRVAILDAKPRPFLRLLRKRFGQNMELYTAVEPGILGALAMYETNVEDRFASLISEAQKQWKGTGEDRSIVELVETLLRYAVRCGASDIHIEPQEQETVVRLRIDGLLQRILTFPTPIHERVLLRIKVLANLATDEHAIPQDGKILYQSPDNIRVDIRVSIVPTIYGGKVVMRLLVSEDQALPLESIGLMEHDRKILSEEAKRTWGMILVTGPTGSGKTTTLYALMRRLNQEHVNISTIEDPIEYRLPGANQIQVNEKVNLTFSTGLRSLVRQDPNIILVGEIRDRETAGIAVNAAMTGHLVLSTLHTNDAPTAMPRLIDMSIEPFLIASTVNVIVAQRLVRKICVRCREGHDVEKKTLESRIPAADLDKLFGKHTTLRLYQGKGCNLCQGSGFRGRIAIFEVLLMDEELRALVVARSSADILREAARKKGVPTMVDDGLEKVRRGLTTVEEVIRVIRS